MQYADFGKRSGLKVGRVSLGAMRFGTDADKAIKTVRTAIDNGVNYIDTSPYYCDSKSEEILGEALQDGYRERVILSSKCSLPRNAKLKDFTAKKVRGVIDQSLKRLKTDYLDYFQLWLVWSYDNYLQMCKKGYHLTAIKQAMKEGIVKRTGITGHPPLGDFPKMFRNEIFEICTISYNYLNSKALPDIRALAKMGVGIVVMNPASGGMLAEKSTVLKKLLPAVKGPTVETAYRYVLGTPGVSTIIAGMDTAAHARQDCRVADMKPLSADQRRTIDRGVKQLRKAINKICTWCGYCKGCPQEIDIPYVFGLYNYYKVLGLTRYARTNYKIYVEKTGWRKGGSPDECIACGKCEKQCPNGISIIQQLKDAHKALRPRA